MQEAIATLDAARAHQSDADARLAKLAAALAPLLPLLLRLSATPAETLLTAPGPPEQSAQAVAILAGLAAQFRDQAARLQAARRDAANSAIVTQSAMATLNRRRRTQDAQAAVLDRQMAEAALRARQGDDAAARAVARAASLGAEAQTLREAVLAVQSARKATRRDGHNAAESAAEAPHRLIVPVSGRVARGWGAPTAAGPSTGIAYAGAPGAVVVSPCAGKVDFAAPFRSYGRLAMIDCGGGLEAVLAGIDRLSAVPGQRVRAGEPVGVMPNYDPAKGGDRPALYLEVRRDGAAIDPTPLL